MPNRNRAGLARNQMQWSAYWRVDGMGGIWRKLRSGILGYTGASYPLDA